MDYASNLESLEFGCIIDPDSNDGLNVTESPCNDVDADGIFIPQGGYGFFSTVAVDGLDHGYTVSCAAFDSTEELVWFGNTGGHVTSYYGPCMQKFTSFQVSNNNTDVRHLLTIDCGVVALMKNSVKCNSRQGLGIFNYTSDNCTDLTTAVARSNSQLLLSGYQKKLLSLDLNRMQELQVFEMKPTEDCAVLRVDERFIYCGDTMGKVTLRDPRTFQAVHHLDAHSGTLSDIDISGSKLVTCGFSNRLGQLTPDRFLMVYDLRTMKSLVPVTTGFDPCFLRFIHSYSDNRMVIASQSGQFQVIELGSYSVPPVAHQVPADMVYAMDISSSQQAIVFADGAGYVHLFGDREQAVFSEVSVPTEFADPLQQLPFISFADEFTSLANIPLPQSTGRLFSDWPEHLCKRVYRNPLPIDPEIIRSTKLVQFIGYSPKPSHLLRNQVPYDLSSEKPTQFNEKLGAGAVLDSPGEDPKSLVPKAYRKVILRSLLKSFEDINYEQFNKTTHIGLEHHAPNAYCNAFILILYHILPLRNVLLSHLCHKEFCLTCELQFLFRNMLVSRKSGKSPVSPKNFVRAFRIMSEAQALSLVLNDKDDEANMKINYGSLIQQFCRYVLGQLHLEIMQKQQTTTTVSSNQTESRQDSTELDESTDDTVTAKEASLPPSVTASLGAPSKVFLGEIFQKLLASSVENVSTCCKCDNKTIRSDKSFVASCTYPLEFESRTTVVSFASILEKSICWEHSTQAWCEKCEKYQPMLHTRHVISLPEVILVNCQIDTNREKEFWTLQQKLAPRPEKKRSTTPAETAPSKTPSISQDLLRARQMSNSPISTCSNEALNIEQTAAPWLPFSLVMSVNNSGRVTVFEPEEFSSANTADVSADGKRYELFAVVCQIRDSTECHLVTFVKADKFNAAVVHASESSDEQTERSRPNSETASETDGHAGSPKRSMRLSERMSESSAGSSGFEPVSGGNSNAERNWILFNDIRLTPVSEEEVRKFCLDWKVPCILCYTAVDIGERYAHIEPYNSLQHMSPLLNHGTESLSMRRRLSSTTFVPLDSDELPKKGDLVALDAEFVTVNQAHMHVSDGQRATIKPSESSLARVTCVRGSGPMEGMPFIDDYISTQEEVVDYLTKWSGIKPGDLNPAITSKHLTTLKATYLKLRYLVDIGVKFVGHGLMNDFKVINLVVPPEQVLDTVLLFHLPRHRMLSLKFLAYYVLGDNIQAGAHDSVEDARTALKLCKKWIELKKAGFETYLTELYETARKLSWDVPEN